MFSNGGFPPLKLKKCKENKNDFSSNDIGFFYTPKNNVDIKDILKEKKNKPTDEKFLAEELNIVDEL